MTPGVGVHLQLDSVSFYIPFRCQRAPRVSARDPIRQKSIGSL